MRNNARNAVSRRRKSEGKREREKKGEKKKYAEQRRKLEVIELAGCGKCGVKNILLNLPSPGIYRYSVEFL